MLRSLDASYSNCSKLLSAWGSSSSSHELDSFTVLISNSIHKANNTMAVIKCVIKIKRIAGRLTMAQENQMCPVNMAAIMIHPKAAS